MAELNPLLREPHAKEKGSRIAGRLRSWLDMTLRRSTLDSQVSPRRVPNTQIIVRHIQGGKMYTIGNEVDPRTVKQIMGGVPLAHLSEDANRLP